MDETLQEFVSSRGQDVRVDRAAGIIRGVKLLGLESRNGRRYLPRALAAAAALYEGAKVNVNHPKGSPLVARDYQDRLGSMRNVRAAADGLFGDLHFNPKHTLAEQLAWDAEHAPENVGFSHNVEARTLRENGRTVVEAILKVQSVDLVADPATTLGLYESASGRPEAGDGVHADGLSRVTLDALRRRRPDVVEAIRTEVAAELTALREEVEALRAGEAERRRRETVLTLFREYKLPEPGTTGHDSLTSELFLETVLAAPDESTMRRLVEERARLIESVRRLDGRDTRPARPVSREQQRGESPRVSLDARGFARSIS